MQKLFDNHNNRLVFVGQRATGEFWEKHWDIENLRKEIIRETRYNYIVRLTRRYLNPSDGHVLEGGCGTGRNVYALNRAGFRCIGIDYARKTIDIVNRIVPEIDVRFGDVRRLEIEDNYFAGYWSLGVIEHFWDGYSEIFSEMRRVLKSGGYLFLTFPHMSPLRVLKVRLKMYPLSDINDIPENFYQFAFDSKQIIKDLETAGFRLKYKKSLDGIKGLKDEFLLFKNILQKLYNYKGDSIIIKGFRFALENMLSPFTGHMKLLVMQLEK